jgi:elongation of very long chain fatty acids protein 7
VIDEHSAPAHIIFTSPPIERNTMESYVSPVLEATLHNVKYYYYDGWNEHGDPRVQAYPLMDGGPWPTILAVIGYLYMSKMAGPALMKHRPAFNLRRPIFMYNLALVAINAYFVLQGVRLTNFGLDSWKCERINSTSDSPTDLMKIRIGWLFLITKFIDFCDTFFFVLRKKDRQLSMLHVFHHSCMPLFCWIGLKFAPGGNSAFFPMLNSLVHTLMYTYYALSTFDRIKPLLWWKKYITQLQMAQFVLVLVHSIYSMLIPGCQWPKPFMYLSIFNAVVFFCLFYSFFRRTYAAKAAAKKLKD